jgi:WD40 repeat protein
MLTYEKFEKHINNCEYGPHICTVCDYVDIRTKIITHSKSCEVNKKYKLNNKVKNLNCTYCRKTFNEKLILIHIYACPEQMVVCKSCDVKMSLKDLKTHEGSVKCLVNQYESRIYYLQEKLNYNENQIGRLKSEIVGLKMFSDLEIEKCQNFKLIYSGSRYEYAEYPINETAVMIGSRISGSSANIVDTIITGKMELNMIEFPLDGLTITTVEEVGSRNITNKTAANILLKLYQDYLVFVSNENHVEFHNMKMMTAKSSVKLELILKEINRNKVTCVKQFTVNRKTKYKDDDDNSYSSDDYMCIGCSNGEYYLYKLIEKTQGVDIINNKKICNTAITHIEYLFSDDDGNHFAGIGTMGNNLKIVNLVSGVVADSLDHKSKSILSIAYVSQCNYLITSTKDQLIRIWQGDGVEYAYELKESVKGHTDFVWCVIPLSLSFDDENNNNLSENNYIASGSGDRQIKIWSLGNEDYATYEVLSILGHKDSVTSLLHYKYNKNNILISGSYDGVIKIWSIEYEIESDIKNLTAKCLQTIFSQKDKINSLQIFPTAKRNSVKYENNSRSFTLVSASDDDTILFTDLKFLYENI